MSTPEDVSVESVGSRAAAPPSPAHSYCIESLSLSGSGRLSQAHYRVDERTSLVTPTNPRKKRPFGGVNGTPKRSSTTAQAILAVKDRSREASDAGLSDSVGRATGLTLRMHGSPLSLNDSTRSIGSTFSLPEEK